MFGHYWLRAPERAPTPEIRDAIIQAREKVAAFATRTHRASIRPQRGDSFTHLISNGIGGSALGPQFVTDALGSPNDPIVATHCDNTDPDGIDRLRLSMRDHLETTLTLVISKSGGTRETQNGLSETRHAYENRGLDFARHAVAITGTNSQLDNLARQQNWLMRFPMWEWVGGRTSVLSTVGLVPAALQGYDVDTALAGAAACDQWTRTYDTKTNPAAWLAMMWFQAGQGRGHKDMVVLPYKDRLRLLGRYLQQLVMESLGKECDRHGHIVHQGTTVYGNKGSTDQHAYIQQLRDGPDDFFVTFIRVLRDREGHSIELDRNVTGGDYLDGFWLGTRDALWEAGRESITITLDRLSAFSLGALVALFERAVGFYASLININAYHQPGVEAGKRAAESVITLQKELFNATRAANGETLTAQQWAQKLKAPTSTETVYQILHAASVSSQSTVRVGWPMALAVGDANGRTIRVPHL